MSTNVEINDRLLEDVMEALRAKTQSAAVEEALRRVLTEEQRERVVQSLKDRSQDGVKTVD